MKTIHVITAFSRLHLKETLIEAYRPMGIIWHPVMFEDEAVKVAFNEAWIQPVIIPGNAPAHNFIAIGTMKINHFIHECAIVDDDYYCLAADDDMYESGVFDAIRKMNDPVIFISLKRGYRIPKGLPPERRHHTDTLFAHPDNVKLGMISGEQYFVMGSIFKTLHFSSELCGDGKIAMHLKENYPVRYEPDLFALFNYYEPGRWGKPVRFGKLTSIIIPCHNQHEITQQCVEAIRKNTSACEIIIIDNGSIPIYESTNRQYVNARSIDNMDVFICRNEENLGFPKAVNQGIEASKGDIITILNNDCILTPHWLEILQGHLGDGFDIVGPVTNSISGPQQMLIDQYEDLSTLYKAAEAHSKKNEGQWYPYHRLVFFCVAIKREVIDKIGLLDEVYTPGNCEDDDFCMRAIEAGYKLGIAKDCYVHHFGSVTHKAMDINYQELLAKNQKVFNEKWAGKYQEMIRKNNQADGAEIVFTGERAICTKKKEE